MILEKACMGTGLHEGGLDLSDQLYTFLNYNSRSSTIIAITYI